MTWLRTLPAIFAMTDVTAMVLPPLGGSGGILPKHQLLPSSIGGLLLDRGRLCIDRHGVLAALLMRQSRRRSRGGGHSPHTESLIITRK
jgi:hypothetical protein